MAEQTPIEILKTELDKFKNVKIDEEKLKELPEEERKFVLIRSSIMYVNGINSIDRLIAQCVDYIRTLLPIPKEELKVILTRIEDLNPDELEDLSTVFIDNLFKIDGKDVEITLPEIGAVDEVEFKRALIKNIRLMDEQVAVANDYKDKLKEEYEKNIPKDIQELSHNVEKLDEYFSGYYKEKLNGTELTDEQKENMKKGIEAKNEARTMKPIIDNLIDQLKKEGGYHSFMYGFYHTNKKTLNAAIEVAHQNKFSFPFKMLLNVDSKLLGNDYFDKKYSNMIIYIIARNIKYNKNNFDIYKKIFFTELFSSLISVNRPNAEEKYHKLYPVMKESVKNLYDTIIKYERKSTVNAK